MAINPNTIKALFSKLKPATKAIAPMADDAAKGVIKYGDDAARAVTNYGDDFLPPATFPDLNAQAALKDRLLDKRLPYDHFEYIAPPRAANELAADVIEGFQDSYYWGRFPRDTDILGPVTKEVSTERNFFPNGTAVMTPQLPTSDLVVDDVIPSEYGYKGFTLRPHKNTALGRWFANALNNPKTATKYNYSIGPSAPPIYVNGTRNPVYGKRFKDYLPF